MKNIRREVLLSAVGFSLLILVAGCGGSDSTPAPSGPNTPTPGGAPATPTPGAKKKWDPAAGTCTISGIVTLKGTSPKMGKIDMKGNPECDQCMPGGCSEETVVCKDGKLQNVFIMVKSGLDAWEFEAPKTEVLLNQVGCQYVPHVFGIQVGQPLRIKNSNPFKHNVNAMSKKQADPFNILQQGNQEDVRTFDQAEMVPLKCNVHAWMTGFVGVVNHPFYAVTDAGGSWKIANLPPGKYTIEAWHEKYKTKRVEVEVKDKETKGDVNFGYEEK